MSNSFVTPWTVARQAPLSMGFLRQKCWSGLPFPSAGDLPSPGIKPTSPALQADSLPLSHLGSHFIYLFYEINFYWSIVALQCCISFYCRAKLISCTHTLFPLFFGFPSHLGCHKALNGVPWTL